MEILNPLNVYSLRQMIMTISDHIMHKFDLNIYDTGFPSSLYILACSLLNDSTHVVIDVEFQAFIAGRFSVHGAVEIPSLGYFLMFS